MEKRNSKNLIGDAPHLQHNVDISSDLKEEKMHSTIIYNLVENLKGNIISKNPLLNVILMLIYKLKFHV